MENVFEKKQAPMDNDLITAIVEFETKGVLDGKNDFGENVHNIGTLFMRLRDLLPLFPIVVSQKKEMKEVEVALEKGLTSLINIRDADEKGKIFDESVSIIKASIVQLKLYLPTLLAIASEEKEKIMNALQRGEELLNVLQFPKDN